MSRALKAALLSAFILPGMGQLYNRKPLKGAGLVILMSFFIIGLAGMLFVKLGQAAEILTAEQAAKGGFSALALAFREVDLTWLIVLLGIMAVIWLLGIVDAYRDGNLADPDGPDQGEEDQP